MDNNLNNQLTPAQQQAIPQADRLLLLNLMQPGINNAQQILQQISTSSLAPYFSEIALWWAGGMRQSKYNVQLWAPIQEEEIFQYPDIFAPDAQEQHDADINQFFADDNDQHMQHQLFDISEISMEQQPGYHYNQITNMEPVQGDQIDDLQVRDLLHDLGNWKPNDNYFSTNKGKYDQVSQNVVTPYLNEVFIPGVERWDEGSRMPTHEKPMTGKYQFDPNFSVPSMAGQQFDLTIKTERRNYILDNGGIRLLRIKIKPPESDEQQNIVDYYVNRLWGDLFAIFSNQELVPYAPIRFFVHINLQGETMTEPHEEVQLNFQTIQNVKTYLTKNQIKDQILNYVKQQIMLDLLTNYYYEEIENVQLQFVNVFILFKRLDFQDTKEYLLQNFRGFHPSPASDNQWNKLDQVKIFEHWKNFSCLEKIVLFCINKSMHRGHSIDRDQLNSLIPNLMEEARSGKVYKIFQYVEELLKKHGINVYLYHDAQNYWLNDFKPPPTEKSFVIVARKAHALIVKNQELQDVLSKDRQTFVLEKPRPKPSRIVKFVFDIETFTDNKKQIPYLICLIQCDNRHRFTFWGLDCAKKFVEFVARLTKTYNRSRLEIWSFNGSKFDNLLIISEMLKVTNDVTILGSNTQIKIIRFKDVLFFDMILMYPGSLQNVATQLNCQVSKKIPLEVAGKSQQWYEEHKKDVIDYCFQDCEILGQIVEKHYEYKKYWGLENMQIGTNSSLSLKLFQAKFLDNKSCPMTGAQNFDQYHREKQSYHGGYTQNIFRGSTKQEFKYLDINSAYPKSMLGNMPYQYVGEMDYVNNEEIHETWLYDIEGEWADGVLQPIYCEPKTGDLELDGTLLYFKCFSRQFRWGIEIKYPKQNNLFKTLIIHKVYQYNSKKPFAKFVEKLYDLRLKFKAENKPDLSQAIKLTLNSLYGKMGQRQFAEIIWCQQPDLFQYMEREDLSGFEEVDEANMIYRLQFEQKPTLNFLGSLVRFAAFITASTRMQLFSMFHLVGFEHIVYSDTDSCISTKNIPAEFIHETRLGAWKIEHEITELTIWGPKFYKFVSKAKHETHEHIKGVRKENYREQLWEELQEHGKTEIVNKNVFKKRFGHVWVDNQKKLIQLRVPNRWFKNLDTHEWQGSRPFLNLNEFKKFREIYAQQ